jgi:hypothetical protein
MVFFNYRLTTLEGNLRLQFSVIKVIFAGAFPLAIFENEFRFYLCDRAGVSFCFSHHRHGATQKK